MKLYCLDIKLESDESLKLKQNIYRLRKINSKNNYPIKIIGHNENIISLYFSMDRTGYIKMKINDRVELFIPDKCSLDGVIIKKYKSIMS